MGISNLAVKSYFDENKVSYEVYIDGDDIYDLDNIDFIVKSPGIRNDTVLLEEAKVRNILVLSDLELFSILFPLAKLIVITGTNGKTTITMLVYELIKNKFKSYLAGNIGVPLFSLRSERTFKNEYVVVEASSYMLEYCYTLHPTIALFTDITPNHLEHHKSFLAYFHAKLRLIVNMKENDLVIFPRNNIFEEEFLQKEFEKVMYDNRKSDNGIMSDGDYLCYNDKVIVKISDTNLNTFFNIQNAIGALVVASKLGISLLMMRKTLKAFRPPNFRLQKTFDDGKLIIYNDAKSTNPFSLISALKSIDKNDERLYWLAGGVKRSEDWYQLDEVIDKIDLAFLYGENRYEIAEYLDNKNIPYYLSNTLDNHIENIIIDELPTILLFSPASPSLDQYSSFEARGRIFNDLIMKRLRIDI